MLAQCLFAYLLNDHFSCFGASNYLEHIVRPVGQIKCNVDVGTKIVRLIVPNEC